MSKTLHVLLDHQIVGELPKKLAAVRWSSGLSHSRQVGTGVHGLSLEDVEGLYVRYGASVLYRCRQILREEDASWDAMHQTFVRAIRYRGSFRREAEPRTWLFSIAHRTCTDILKKRRHPARLDVDGNELEALEAAIEQRPCSMEDRLVQTRTVARLLSMFSESIQQIVVMRYFDELEVQEIAARTRLSERTVARRLQQFIERSRRLMKTEVSA